MFQPLIGNLFSIPTAMSNGAEIRFVNNKMEVRKKNDMFEFLPSNTNSYGSLLEIRYVQVRSVKKLIPVEQTQRTLT